jgi:hypothetical protein
MHALSALFLIAGTISLTSLLASCAGQPAGRIFRERESLRRSIGRSLAELDQELDRFDAAAGTTGVEGKRQIFEEIGRLEDLKDSLLLQERTLRKADTQNWNEEVDRTLRMLEAARMFLAREDQSLPVRHG